jgi:hypothetical protein
MLKPFLVRVQTQFFDPSNPPDAYEFFPVISMGECLGNDTVTFLVDDEAREYAVIDTDNPAFGGFEIDA